jgi:hypothetical protein
LIVSCLKRLLLLLAVTLIIGGGGVMRVKEMFTFMADVVLGLRMLGNFYQFFNSECLWVESLFNHKGLVFFRSLGGQNVHDVSVWKLLGFVEIRR